MSFDYKKAGVDVEAGDAFVDWIQASSQGKQPHQDQILSGVGGFAAVFRLAAQKYQKPCLVSATDGVGTKVKLAAQFARYEEVGQDLVAMCVNDLICTGAQPLFFLDYYASGKLELTAAQKFLNGVRQACHASDCALIGGETAEMPGVYQPPEFDCAGFAVGVVEEDRILGARHVRVGSRVIGVSSNGFHSNGFSLLRRVFERDLETWKDELLKPTHLYVRLVQSLVPDNRLQAVAHITGGGMENLPRVMPKGTYLELLPWRWPAPFIEVQDRAGLSRTEMLRTLNCGIGLALFVAPENASVVQDQIVKMGFQAYELGTIAAASDAQAEPEVRY